MKPEDTRELSREVGAVDQASSQSDEERTEDDHGLVPSDASHDPARDDDDDGLDNDEGQEVGAGLGRRDSVDRFWATRGSGGSVSMECDP